MIATITRQQVGTVERALKIFMKLGLVEPLPSGALYMSNIELLIGQSSTEGERKRRARLALQEQKASYDKVQKINQYLRKELVKIPGAHINSPEDAIPYILNVSFDQITSEVLLNALDQKGVCVSAKSTCSSHSKHASAILLHMGYDEKIATHMIRLSFDKDNTIEQAKEFIEICKEIFKKLWITNMIIY